MVPSVGTYVLDVGARHVGADVTTRDEWVPTRVEGIAAGTDGVVVRLSRGSAIDGTLVDDVGDPVARRVKVDAVRRTAAGDPDFTMRKVVFADGGAFRVPGLSPGSYDLWVIPEAAPGDVGGARLSSTVLRAVEAGTRGLVVRLSRGFVLRGASKTAGTVVTALEGSWRIARAIPSATIRWSARSRATARSASGPSMTAIDTICTRRASPGGARAWPRGWILATRASSWRSRPHAGSEVA
jgi:hypothetical protein